MLVVHGPRAEGALHHDELTPSAWQLMLTRAGMIGVVNSVVIGACAGLAVETLPIGSLAVSLMAGSIARLVALLLQRRHHRRVRDAYGPERIDRAAIFVPLPQEADAARSRRSLRSLADTMWTNTTVMTFRRSPTRSGVEDRSTPPASS
jgi:hypothetical protein